MRKRIIALLLALILTVGLLPTVALATEGDTPAAGTSNDVKNGYYEGTTWKEGTLNQDTLPTGVESVSKTAKKVEGEENKYEVTLKVVLKQTEENSGKAATVLVLDTSGSMAYCAECGAEDDCVHNYVSVPGKPSKKETYYYKYTNENGQVRFGEAYYCDGEHTARLWLKHSAGWFTTSGDSLDHKPTRDSLAGQTMYVKSTTPRASRLDAAKVAAENFLKTYSGLKFNTDGTVAANQTDRNLGRYVSVVTFATGVTLRRDWIDVSNPAGYKNVLGVFTGNSLEADGGTNLDAGLTYAEYLLKQDTMKNATKNVIALTDGEPTYYLSTNKRCIDRDCDCKNGSTGVGTKSYYVHGHGNACSTDTKSATDNAANALKNNNFSDLYTICFGVAEGKMKRQWDDGGFLEEGHWIYWDITVGQYLQSIASSKAGKQFAYTADNAAQLNTAFAAITDTIVSGLDTGTVRDKLPTAGITAKNASGEEIEIPETWDLERDFEKKTETPTTTGDKKVTTYTYTKTYYVTIDPEKAATTEINGEKYAPLNGETTLTVEVAGEEKTIHFPIPAGKVTPKEYTVKGIIDNGGKVNNTDSPYTETVESGKTSKAMTFVPATGYVIDTITEKIGTDEPTSITVSDANKNSYTYDAKTVTADITVTVTTKKRTDLSYTVKYVDKDTNAEIRQSETTSNQQFGAEINVAEMNKPTITGYTYNSCSPIDKLTIGTGENVITLYYTKNKHNITYVYAEGSPTNAPSLESYNETDILYGAPKTRKGTPTLTGWTFSGWTTGDVDVAEDGTFTMPDKNVIFTGSWTEKGRATINYVVVGPEGCGTVDPASETPYVDAGANAVRGSTATATSDYRFVGWYDNANCTGDALTTAADYTPQKSGEKWTGATYYAKFEAIPTPGADDLPKVNVICTNTVMGHAASENNALVVGTYTVDGTQYASGIYTCKVKLNVIQGYIDTYNTSNSGHTDDAANANLLEITLTYDATDGTWTNSTGNFKIYVVCNTTEFDVTYNWTGLDDATFESAVKPELPSKAKVTKGGKHTVDTGYKAGDIRVATNGDKYRFSGWSTTDADIVSGEITNIQKNIALIGEWTKLGNGTFDLNNKILKSFNKKTNSRDIPGDKKYTFEVTVTRLDKENNNQKTDEVYTGAVTLDGATGAATSSFVFNNQITFHIGGEYRFLVEEKPNTVTTLSSDEQIDYDNAVYYLYVTVSDDLKTINYRFDHVVVITSAEEEPAAAENQTITFYNYYDAAKDPGTYPIDFSTLIFKVLTKTGDRSFNGAEFTASVDGWKVNQYDVMSMRVIKTHFVDLQPVTLKATFPANTTFDADGKAYRGFTGDTLTVTAGRYLFLIDEINDGQTNITYDESKYWLNLGFVENAEGEVSLAGQRVRKFVDGDTYETVLALEDSEWMVVDTSISPVYFENTIDTGKDDYYPIIIPTIINKDTGMLNKTDHFAYVIGYPDGTVHPNGQITRAEVATIFFRLLRDEVRDGAFTTSNTYSDVAYGKWYNNPISTMSALGIITGYPDGTFKPNKPITRAEFAAIAARFDETQSGKSATFSDVIGHWAAKEIGIAYYNDWIKGYPDGTFKPDQNITRAEAMTLINRVLERKPESPADLLTNMNKWTDNMDTSKWYYLDVQEATNSHGYTRKTFNYELWRQMLPDPDWSRYER